MPVNKYNPRESAPMLTENTLTAPLTAAVEKPPVLVVDAEYGPRESIAFSLGSEFAVETAERAKEALAKLKAKPFAAVVLDIRMPEMDGAEFLERVFSRWPDTKRVLLTGYADEHPPNARLTV